MTQTVDHLLPDPGGNPVQSTPACILVNAIRSGDGGNNYLPLGLLAVAASLVENGIQVHVFDGKTNQDYESEVLRIVAAGNIPMVGLSVMTCQIGVSLGLSRKIRAVSPHTRIVWGGVHPSLFPQQVAMCPEVDIVVMKEGHQTAVELFRRMVNREDWRRVEGIAFMDEGVYHENRCVTSERYDIPPLPYELMDLRLYMSRDYSYMPSLPPDQRRMSTIDVISSVGCPYKCRFCINVAQDRSYRQRDVEVFVAELERLVAKYGCRVFNIFDEYFMRSKKWVQEFMRLKRSRGLDFYWTATARANLFRKIITPDLLREMRENGCLELGIGAESGSQRVLDYLKKDITVEDLFRVNAMSRDASLTIAYSFMAGVPSETREEFGMTVKTIVRLCEENPHARIMGPQLYRPYPGAPIYEDALKSGLRMPGTLDEWVEQFSGVLDFDLLKAGEMSWIEHPDELSTSRDLLALYYTMRLRSSSTLTNSLKGLARRLLAFRLSRNITRFPLELMLWNRYVRRCSNAGAPRCT